MAESHSFFIFLLPQIIGSNGLRALKQIFETLGLVCCWQKKWASTKGKAALDSEDTQIRLKHYTQ